MTPVSCPHCGTSLNLDGLCPRCVALEFLTPLPPPALGPMTDAPESGEYLRYFGDYEILNEIAHGGMGVVYRARQVSLDRVVAVKMLLVSPRLDPSFRERFHAEAHAAASLHHPGIVTIHEVGEHEGMPYFSMDHVAGKTLAELTRDGALPARDAAEYLVQAAAAVQHAHERGIIHRDLKPSNVMVDEHGKVRVTDFGLAKRLDVGSDLTLTGHVIGTPGYMAPEQGARTALSASSGTEEILVDKAVRAPAVAADVYSLGATLYHLLTGRAPFTGSNAGDILRQVAEADPVAPTQLNPSVPRDLETITLKCLEKETSRRYSSAAELAEELGRFVRGEPIHARPASPAEKLWRWSRRKPALASALGACVLFLVAGVAGILWQLRQTEAARAEAAVLARNEGANRQRAEHSELVTRQNLYAADMLAVQRSLDDHDLGTARQLLDAHRPVPGREDLRGFEWRFFWRLARGRELASLPSGRAAVRLVTYSPDGKWLALGSGKVTIWNTATRELGAEGVESGPISVAFTSDGRSVFVGDEKGVVYRWAWAAGERPVEFYRGSNTFARVALCPTGNLLAVGIGARMTGEPEGTVELVESTTGRRVRALPESGGFATFSPDGQRLATGSWRGDVKLWETAGGNLVQTITNGAVTMSLRFSPDGRWLAGCNMTGEYWIFDTETGARWPGPRGHSARVWEATFSPDGTSLATASSDQSVRTWDIASGRQKALFLGHEYEVWRVAWSPDGQMLASAGLDGFGKLWHVNREEESEEQISAATNPRLLSQDGHWLATTAPSGMVRVYRCPELKATGEPFRGGYPLRFLPNTPVLVTLEFDRDGPLEAQQWSIPECKLLRRSPLPERIGRMNNFLLSPNGRWLVAGTDRAELKLWDLEGEAKFVRLPAQSSNAIAGVAFSPRSDLLAVSFNNTGFIRLWNLNTREPIGDLDKHRSPAPHLLFSPDGQTLISGGSDRSIFVWDVATLKSTAELTGSREGISALDLAPDGRTIASASEDRFVRLWNLTTRREVGRLPVDRTATFLSFSKDGNALLVTEGFGHQPETHTIVWRAPGFEETDGNAVGKGSSGARAPPSR